MLFYIHGTIFVAFIDGWSAWKHQSDADDIPDSEPQTARRHRITAARPERSAGVPKDWFGDPSR